MSRIKTLKQQRIDAHNAIKQVRDDAEDRPMTDEERATVKAKEAEILALDEDIQLEQASLDRERAWEAPPDPDQQAAAAAARAAGIRVGQNRQELDPTCGFRSHREQLMAIIQAGRTGRVDPRLLPLRREAAAGDDEHGTHTAPHGGFLLAPAFSPDILSVRAEVDPTAGRVRSVPMTASRVVFNARVDKDHSTSVSGGLTVSRTPETQAATASRMEFEKVELVAHDLVGAAFATNRILSESPISFVALLESGFQDEFAAKHLDERLNGSGTGEFEGVLESPALITVNKETGQKADTILFENINKMRARCWRYGDAIWLANHDTLPQVTTLYMPIGTGGERIPIYQPGSEDAPQGTLLGRPIFFTEFAQKLGDKGDILLGVWSEYLEGLMGGLEQRSSVHVRFLEREETFLFVVLDDAKSWWRAALNPKYSNQTLSPWVTLQARA